MNRDLSHDNDTLCLHVISDGLKDFLAFRKKIAIIHGENSSDDEVWANPLHEQYRSIFESISIA